VSPLDPEIPAAGEEIHLPGPSILPVIFTLGATLGLVGVVEGPVLWIPGVLIVLYTAVRWMRDTARDIDELPLDHHQH
jgi:hypothetical protein